MITVPITMELSLIPVELAAFEAKPLRDEVQLLWSTATETNNRGFYIERRDNQKGGWHELKFIEGKGTSSEITEYSFADRNLKPGSYEYRLRQTDLNGVVAFSQTVKAEVGLPTEFALFQNYPNRLTLQQPLRLQFRELKAGARWGYS